MNYQHIKLSNHQKGLSTLVVVLLLLFVATLVTLYTANSALREQMASANQYRSDQALAAADAGLDYALAYYSKYSGPDGDADGVIDDATDGFEVRGELLTSTDLVLSADVVFQETTLTITDDQNGDTILDNDALDAPHIVTSVGHSDDGSAIRTITMEVDTAGIVPAGGLPGFPLVARGWASTSGNFSIVNRFAHQTIWTGADTLGTGSSNTYVAPPGFTGDHDDYIDLYKVGTANPEEVLNASYSQSGINSDIIESDDNLANMTVDQFFENFMNETKATVRSFADGIGQRFDDAVEWNDLTVSNGVRGLVWIDGNWEPRIRNQLGSEQYPITIIVNGDFRTTGAGPGSSPNNPVPDVIGLIYVIGDWVGSGNAIIQGGVIVEGNVGITGSPIIVYDDNLYDGSLGNPPGALAAVKVGTWKDW